MNIIRRPLFLFRNSEISTVSVVVGIPRSYYPAKDRALFLKALSELAVLFSQMTGREITSGAVSAQLAWATTTQRELKDCSLVRNYILNKAAALEVGFIGLGDLPEGLIMTGYTKDRPIRTHERLEDEMRELEEWIDREISGGSPVSRAFNS